ncbi:hypothetical protein KY386_03860 [Candidatus Parcubacteria bacterium]|nr:hypothetical protein [Candidatus Parcubacteria bacterium]
MLKQKLKLTTSRLAPSLIAALLIQLLAPFMVLPAHAGTLSQVLVRFDRMKISTGTTGTVCAKPATAGTEATVKVSFPASYTLGLAATFTVSTTNLAWPTGGTAWPGIGTATAVSGQDVTFPSTDLTVGTLYCFNWTSTSAVTVKSTATSSNAGSVTTEATGPATIDSGSFSTASISDDQITVTASVNQTFSFALSGNSDALGTLSTGAVSSSPTPRTATVNTNAKNGWQAWAKDSNTGLNSAAAGSTIASTTPGTNSTLTAGTEGYNTGVTSSQTGGSGTIAVATPFVGGTAGRGGGLNTSLATIATSNGTADNAVLTLTNNAAIGSTTAAASDYTDVITVVAGGLF